MRAWWRAARPNPFFRLGLLVALGVIVLDQLTKHWILYGIRLPDRFGNRIEISGIFDLTYVENTGVSFGLFAGGLASRVLLSVLAVVVAAYVVRWLGTLHRRVAAIGGGFIVGGALGNVYDRVLYGYVVDFLDFSGLHFPFVFNVADAAINVGVACLVYDALFVAPKRELTETTDA
ncbi:signal peptidase II [Parvularcula dongshanensis]|uniref:Lipoprotein signal peptidase n=1 Tax=Parvularcula dongshanensis TaxID=1173995 RepID=A0A840I3R2_9PROT|nr:signal peptidase II [Parvularcula dongshanensis]